MFMNVWSSALCPSVWNAKSKGILASKIITSTSTKMLNSQPKILVGSVVGVIDQRALQIHKVYWFVWN